MLIALDYDNTYTRDLTLWDQFIRAAHNRGHHVVIVTMRYPSEEIINPPCAVIYTCRQAKSGYCQADIWIDDSPAWIYQDAL